MHNQPYNSGSKIETIVAYAVSLYIILATMFEESNLGFSQLASWGIIICLCACLLYTFLLRTIIIEWYIKALFIFGLLITIGIMYSPASVSLMSMYIYRYWTSFVLLFLVSNTMRDKGNIYILINGYVVAGVALSLYMYAFYGIGFLSLLTSRLTGEMGNQNTIGVSCAFSIILSMIFAAKNVNNKRWLYIIAIVICLPACLFSGSRKSILMLIVGIAVFCISFTNNKRFIKGALIASILICGVIVLLRNVSAFSVIFGRLEQLFDIFGNDRTSLDVGDLHRMEYINIGWHEFLNKPIFGNGFLYSYSRFGEYSHCNYIELLLNHGVVAFFAYYYVHLRLLKGAFIIRGDDRFSSAIILTIVAMLLFMDIGVVNYYSRYVFILLCICSKLLLPEQQIHKENETVRNTNASY